MILEDGLLHAAQAILAHRLRSLLTMLGTTVGIAAVVLLTSIGEGVRKYLISEFTQFGANLVAVTPGSTETSGMMGAVGTTITPLTLDDATAISRLRGVRAVVPLSVGAAAVEHDAMSRNVFVYGVSHSMPEAWRVAIRSGRFLPEGDLRGGAPQAVLGPTLARELFASRNPLGEHVRIGGRRFLVIGILEHKGDFIGIDLDDAAYIPVALAQQLFHRDELQEIDVLLDNSTLEADFKVQLEKLLSERHGREKDFTLTTQTGMLESLDRILDIVSFAIAGIAAISLLVGAIGILTMLWISVNERTSEIGLARALGATGSQILGLFLAEAVLLAGLGGILGVLLGLLLAAGLRALGIPAHTPLPIILTAFAVALCVGLLSGILPARRAARMDPVQALASE